MYSETRNDLENKQNLATMLRVIVQMWGIEFRLGTIWKKIITGVPENLAFIIHGLNTTYLQNDQAFSITKKGSGSINKPSSLIQYLPKTW